MIKISRLQLVLVTYLFGLFHASLGLFWSTEYKSRLAGVVAVVIFVVALSMTVLMHRGLNVPKWQGLVNLLTSAGLTALIEEQIDASHYGTYATWYVGALGVLLGATALRGQYYWAIGGVIFTLAEIVIYEGVDRLGPSGMVGLIVLVAVGMATSFGLQRSERDIESYVFDAQGAALSLKRAQVKRETQSRNFAGSQEEVKAMLRRIIAQKGKLSADDRDEARQLESHISDAVMGGKLVSVAVSAAARQARARGIEVFFFDEGGLESLDELELNEIHQHIIEVLSEQRTGRVISRANPKTQWRVSVVAYEKRSTVPNVDWKF